MSSVAEWYPLGMVLFGIPMILAFMCAFKESVAELLAKKKTISSVEKIAHELSWAVAYGIMITLWPVFTVVLLMKMIQLIDKGGDDTDDSSQS